MQSNALPAAVQPGFLKIMHDATGYAGGYLVTNSWGRPLECRLSSSVAPNKVQQILYGRTLEEFLHAELIGKTLIEKTSTAVHLLIVDAPATLAMRERLDVPVLLLEPADAPPWPCPEGGDYAVHANVSTKGRLLRSAAHQADAERIDALLAMLDRSFDLSEPFLRVREAMMEYRKMGGSQRAA
ncbi:hypothetical protein [Tuwongella immobilis]|uniref:Uncharacterized protein n=1 Tax=Tuwongella immobilis TaxID=692036 RepID=A0A6C2YK15_9BACT|nr:hypothetical protein [Tuwongella immobilis]VIP01918.1 Uncharacterized protein OS=Planctomyces limnophilus (strain ATCC 43296 / DSM 3776 / IFAM 1008 / 290) GN=Plim_0367 PE=4 SV=1 [Tuwongella immobilis]VTR99842.1 Uncharacterized protein OS=Planctomyces limnophilus (strain ATCC 43296 / DSM 3776 / IFAM 1008 / 290) GN=Plim_0367 PE=4 SV=1 [Tuwongella immobilis]